MKKLSRPILARNKTDAHRAATELELLFDLVFVIAIALTAAGLHHAIAEGHYADGIIKFLLAFFALWWPWNHFTWFASAFDNDDATYRTSVMVMMFGALMIAGSMPSFFESMDLRLMAVGYAILRLAYTFLWYRAGKANPDYKITARRYIWGQVFIQTGWLASAFLIPIGSDYVLIGFSIGVLLELFIPYYANRAKTMPWHKGHIVERYGLLNIIVLGEIVLSAALALQSMNKSGHWTLDLILIAVCATIVPFVLWWLYFCEEENLSSEERDHVFMWGYGHYIIFASGAAIGAGFSALIDASGEHPHGDPIAALWLITTSIFFYVFGLWFIRDRHILHVKSASLLLLFSALILLSPLFPIVTLPLATGLLVVALIFRIYGNA